jgi:DNA-binding transcriptional ArsR family regulator
LAEKQECICGDLVLDLPLAQSTVSQHLKALKEIGLIRGTVDGPRSRYCVDWKVFDKYQRQLGEWSAKMLQLRQDNCC